MVESKSVGQSVGVGESKSQVVDVNQLAILGNLTLGAPHKFVNQLQYLS